MKQLDNKDLKIFLDFLNEFQLKDIELWAERTKWEGNSEELNRLLYKIWHNLKKVR